MSVPYTRTHGKKIISYLFANHVYCPYSIEIDRDKRKHTNFRIWRKLCFNPYSEQTRCMPNANTRISSFAV